MLTIEKKSLRVGKYVDANHVDSLVRTYKQERWAQNSDRIGKDDSLNVYYTIDELQEFLERAKQAGANGIRVHFGAYPENFAKPEYAGLQTTVFVATKQQETETGLIEKNVYVTTEQGLRIMAYNMGGLGRSEGGDEDWGGIGTTLVDRGDKGMVVI
jgi:hypothetical protein